MVDNRQLVACIDLIHQEPQTSMFVFFFFFFHFFFFFQAEDGIRAHCVTGVQTCALPISYTHFVVVVTPIPDPIAPRH